MAAPTPIWKGTTSLVETVNSGVLKYAERVRYTQEFEGPKATVLTAAGSYTRGTIVTISPFAGSFIVEDSVVKVERGGKGVLSINYCWLGSLPPDEWSVTPYEINPPLERNGYFSGLTTADLKKAKTSFNAATAAGQTSIDSAIAASSNGTLTNALVNKWLKGVETFYLAGLKYSWTTYLYSLGSVTLRQGGYRETPGGPGSFPTQVWLRQADELVWNNGLYRLTRTWIGAPSWAGVWDTDIYGTTPQ